MANDVLNINVETKPKNKTTKVSSTTKKDSPSLFDQMISKNASKSKETKVSEKKQNEITSNTKEKTSPELNKKQVSKTIQSDTNISLFDKLKKSSKNIATSKDIKTEEEKVTTKDSQSKVSLFDSLKDVNKKNQIEKSNKKDTVLENIGKKEKNSTEEKTTNSHKTKVSLFDSIKNTSKESKISTKESQKDILKETIEIKIDENSEKLELQKQNLLTANISVNNINKKDFEKTKEVDNSKNNTNKKSLLDNLVSKIKNEESLKKDNLELNSKDKVEIKDKLNAKTFLSNQNTKATIISKQHIAEAKNILLDENTKDSKSKIINSAKTLELGVKSVEVTNEEKSISNIKSINKIDSKVQEQTTFLNKVLFTQALNIQNNKAIEDIKIQNKSNELENTTKEIKSEDIQIKETSAQTAIQNITNKIISARQNMKSFMSDMSRKMYENYKPPVTAFKINLNPANLGSISITMKSEKSTNSISISMSASQSSTLEVLEGAKGLLQSSLQKTFDTQSNFSLDFSQQDNQSNTQDEQNNKQNNKSNNNSNEEIEDIIENDISINDGYM